LKDANQRTVENGAPLQALHQIGSSMHHTKSHQPQPSSASAPAPAPAPSSGRYCCSANMAGTISTPAPPLGLFWSCHYCTPVAGNATSTTTSGYLGGEGQAGRVKWPGHPADRQLPPVSPPLPPHSVASVVIRALNLGSTLQPLSSSIVPTTVFGKMCQTGLPT
jgi:hypothetical protein